MSRLTTDEQLMTENELITSWLKQGKISLQQIIDQYAKITRVELQIENLTNGRYELGEKAKKLYFVCSSDNSDILIDIDKKSALEIAHTLIDSLDLLDKNAEELLLKIDERINN